MEFLIDLKFEDQGYNAIVHFVSTFVASNNNEADEFFTELISAFKRRGVIIITSSCYPIDMDKIQRERAYEYYDFCQRRATAAVRIEQFVLDKPDQNKSLIENLTDKFFKGEYSTA